MVVVGRAMPVLEADFFAATEPGGHCPLCAQPFGLLFEALDEPEARRGLRRHRRVAAFALWGGLMTRAPCT